MEIGNKNECGDEMRIGCWTICGIFFAIVVVCLLGDWMIAGENFFLYSYFAPRQEAVRRQTFEQSTAYNKGVASDLEHAEIEYKTAKDPEAKKAIKAYVLHEVEGYNLNDPDISDNTRQFVKKLKETQ